MKSVWARNFHIRIKVLMPEAFKFIRYALVGLLSSAIYLTSVYFLVSKNNIDHKLASVLGYCAAIPVNFVFNRHFSFRSKGPIGNELVSFLTTHFVSMALIYVMMALFVDRLGLSYLLIASFTIVALPVLSFFILNIWVFSGQKK